MIRNSFNKYLKMYFDYKPSEEEEIRNIIYSKCYTNQIINIITILKSSTLKCKTEIKTLALLGESYLKIVVWYSLPVQTIEVKQLIQSLQKLTEKENIFIEFENTPKNNLERLRSKIL